MAGQLNELARYGLSQKLRTDSSDTTLMAASVGSVSASLTMISVFFLPMAALLVNWLHG